VGYNLFQRRHDAGASVSEFAATVASLPPAAVDSLPAAVDSLPPGPESLPSAVDSGLLDVVTDLGGESLPAPVDATVEQRPTISHIGRYALKGLLGQGGLGQVHEAWDPVLSRTVAVKTLQFDLDTPTRVSLDGLFLNEARAAAGLSHPHIVTVFDAGLSAHGVYIAMERLHGSDLRLKLAAGWRPAPMQAALLVRRVADALAYAHARGVVHCDIKPANIFLNRRDKPKVLDFGIARVTHGAVLPALDGMVAGSPHYLAPEQLQGGVVDARTDIHALGVVFYELLTGRKAYAGDSLEQITNAVLNNHLAPAHEVRPGVSPTLAAIAAKAMAHDAAERYASAAEMAAALRRWIDRHRAGAMASRETAVPAPAPAPARAAARQVRPALLAAGLLGAAGLVAAWLVLMPVPEPAAGGTRPVAPVPLAAVPALATAPTIHAQDLAQNGDATMPPDAAATGAGLAAPGGGADPAAQEGPARTAEPARRAPAGAAPGHAATSRPRATTAAPPMARRAAGTGTGTGSGSGTATVATGAVQLAISPWGHVEVNGTAAGTAPPLTRLTLPEGRHTVTVRNADFPPYTTSVQVSADEPVTVRHRFAP
jgi:serine/threonine-protein kinase